MTSGRPRWRALLDGPWPNRVGVGAVALVGAALALALAGRVDTPIGPFDTTFSAHPSTEGVTRIRLAPLGTIELDTHTGPIAIDVRVEELRPDAAARIAREPSVLEGVEDDIADDARRGLLALLLRGLLLAVAGGGLAVLLVFRRRRAAIAGAIVGVMGAGALVVAAATTFDAEAVAEPRYSGLLALAPRAVGDVESIVEQFEDYRVQLSGLVGNVVTLYEAGQSLPGLDPGDDAIRVLHVSDIHNNPQAFDLIEQLVAQFDVEAVFDSGDISDWGSQPETELLGAIGDLGVPYVYVRGNHDSQVTQQAVAAQPNAVVLDGEATEVAGLRVFGTGDPRYTPDKDQPTGRDTERDQADAYAFQVRRQLRRAGLVDVVLVHDARIAASSGAWTPLVLAGHTHAPRHDAIDEAHLLVEGSTGGAGLRGLQDEEPHPLTASLLYFDPDSKRLVAYDRISVDGLGGAGARIERHLVDLREPEAEDDEPDQARGLGMRVAGVGQSSTWTPRVAVELGGRPK